MPFAVDDSRYPVLVVRLTDPTTDADVQSFIDSNLAYLRRQEPHAQIIDMLSLTKSAPNQRRMVAAYVHDNAEELGKYRKGTAFVLGSPLSRGIVTAVMWLQRPPYPFRLVGTVEEALVWCESKLGRAS